jgi:hypothetical protein
LKKTTTKSPPKLMKFLKKNSEINKHLNDSTQNQLGYTRRVIGAKYPALPD